MPSLDTLRPRQNCRYFSDAIFKCIFLNENVLISLKISLTFGPKVRINNIPALVQIMAWCRSGDKPLSEPMMVRLLTHICVPLSQWVKGTATWKEWSFFFANRCIRYIFKITRSLAKPSISSYSCYIILAYPLDSNNQHQTHQGMCRMFNNFQMHCLKGNSSLEFHRCLNFCTCVSINLIFSDVIFLWYYTSEKFIMGK